MGAYLSTPVTDKEVFEGSGATVTYGGGSMQGWRRTMEDAHLAEVGLPGNPDVAIFGVFDGHGGAEVAKFCQKYMASEVQKLDRLALDGGGAGGTGGAGGNGNGGNGGGGGSVEDCLVAAFHRMDEMLRDHAYADELEALKARDELDDEDGAGGPGGGPGGAGGAGGQQDDGVVGLDALEMIRRVFQIKRWQQTQQQQAQQQQQLQQAQQGQPDGEGGGGDGALVDLDELVGGAGAGAASAANGVGGSGGGDGSSEELGAAAAAAGAGDEGAAAAAAAAAAAGSSGEDSAAGPAAVAPPPRLPLEPADMRVQAGCTAVVAVKCGGELYVANAGDSRGVLCRGGQAVALSEDHKPAQEGERARILNAGGFLSEIGGVCRVNGNLNLSRAIGDLRYKGNSELPPKDQIITAQPDVRRVALQPEDSFFVLACDGVWDVMSNQECVDFISARLAAGAKPADAACALLDACLAADPKAARGVGCDNMTAIVVTLTGPGPQDSTAAAASSAAAAAASSDASAAAPAAATPMEPDS